MHCLQQCTGEAPRKKPYQLRSRSCTWSEIKSGPFFHFVIIVVIFFHICSMCLVHPGSLILWRLICCHAGCWIQAMQPRFFDGQWNLAVRRGRSWRDRWCVGRDVRGSLAWYAGTHASRCSAGCYSGGYLAYSLQCFSLQNMVAASNSETCGGVMRQWGILKPSVRVR